MKQDIRELFKTEDELKILPNSHRDEFLNKLQEKPKKTSRIFYWVSVAAIIIIALTVGVNSFYNSNIEPNNPPMLTQIEAVEAEYLEDIEKEWQNFIAITDDKVLVARFRKRLDELDNDYKEITTQFKENSNNVIVIESLIENLKTRLQLLKDIQDHIKILNQNNEQYEKSI